MAKFNLILHKEFPVDTDDWDGGDAFLAEAVKAIDPKETDLDLVSPTTLHDAMRAILSNDIEDAGIELQIVDENDFEIQVLDDLGNPIDIVN